MNIYHSSFQLCPGMNKPVIILTVILSIICSSCAQFDIKITNEQIKKELDNQFPVKKTYFFIFELVYENPIVVLKNGSDRINVGLDAHLNFKSILEGSEAMGGSVELSSGIDFNPETGEFFLINCQIDKILIDGIPSKYTAKVNEIANIAAKEFLNNFPVYILNAGDIRMTTAKLTLKDMRIKNGVIIITLGI